MHRGARNSINNPRIYVTKNIFLVTMFMQNAPEALSINTHVNKHYTFLGRSDIDFGWISSRRPLHIAIDYSAVTCALDAFIPSMAVT